MVYSREEIGNEFADIAERMGVPHSKRIIRFKTEFGMGEYYVEISRNGDLSCVASERGIEIFRKKARSLEDLMFCLFESIASEVASHWEVAHRQEGKDFRRLYFEKQLELLGKVSKHWRNRKEEEIRQILLSSPYSDE